KEESQARLDPPIRGGPRFAARLGLSTIDDSGWGWREAHGEARAAEGRLTDLDVRVVVPRLLHDEREPEPAARAVGPVDAGERGEDPLAVARGHAGAVVVDVHDRAAAAVRREQDDVDAAARPAVARRVGDEVADEDA